MILFWVCVGLVILAMLVSIVAAFLKQEVEPMRQYVVLVASDELFWGDGVKTIYGPALHRDAMQLYRYLREKGQLCEVRQLIPAGLV